MNAVGAIVFVLAAAVVLFSGFLAAKRFREGGSCCGSAEKAPKRIRRRIKKSDYPYSTAVIITGMVCENCSVRAENALNGLEGVWAKVDLSSRKAKIRSAAPIDMKKIKAALGSEGFGVGENE